MNNTIYRKLFFIPGLILFSLTYAITISMLLSPNNLAPGGVSGISIMVNYLWGFPTGLTIFCLNVPLLIISYRKLGKSFFFKTLAAICLTTIFIDLFEKNQIFADYGLIPVTTNPILAALIGGFLMALSIGSLFKLGATTGGSDILVRLLKLKYPYIETGRLFMIVDTIIVSISALVFKSIESALYAFITIYVSSYFLDRVLYGTDKAILMFVITTKESSVADSLLIDLNIGATLLHGTGAYSMEERNVIMCGIKKHQYTKAEELIYSIDSDAFIIITSANEILGQGFRSHNAPKL